MENNNHQKIKLLKLIKLLRRETDEQHPIKRTDLCKRIQDMGITCDPRTLSKDIALLNEEGYEIMSTQIKHDRCYYIEDRSFSIPELKLLIDAVQASTFITEKKSQELIEKIAALGSSHRKEILKSNLVCFNTRKHRNEEIYYNVEALENCLNNRKQVSFYYFSLDENGEKIYHNEKKRYIVDPVAMIFHEDNYYLRAYSQEHEQVRNYRVDRMDHVVAEDTDICEEAAAYIPNMAEYTEQTFKMYGGERESVKISFADHLIGAVFDKFGEDTPMKRVDEHTCTASVMVQISPPFWGWLFMFSGEMQILSPENVREQYIELAKQITGQE